jgi:hypothetical protein
MCRIARVGSVGAGTSRRPTDRPCPAVQVKMTQGQQFLDRSLIPELYGQGAEEKY